MSTSRIKRLEQSYELGSTSYSSSYSSSSSNSTGGGSLPLRADFFRSLPLSRRARADLRAEARRNARACLRLAFSAQWRFVPPGRDGAQVRKDTSNLAESRRLVRAAAVLRCRDHELAQVLANTSSESWRELARRCGGRRLADAQLLHTVRAAPSAAASSSRGRQATHEPRGSDAGDELGRGSQFTTSSHEQGAPRRLERRTSEVCAADMRARPLQHRRPRRSRSSSASNQNEEEEDADEEEDDGADPDGLGTGAEDELLTVKWLAFDAACSGGGRRDLCVVDYLSSALLPGEDESEDAADAVADRERVQLWCLASTDGERVGCMRLRESHGLRRAELPRLGVFWRRVAEHESEVVVCGSFPSRHAPAAAAALLAGLARLQLVVEDLRLSCQPLLPRSAWVSDRARASCRLCLRNFFALRRKHHCRRCGEVVCADCSAVERVDRPGIGRAKLRLCKLCGLQARATPLSRAGGRENVFGRLERATRSASFSGSSKRSDVGDGGDVGDLSSSSGSDAALTAGINNNQSSSDDERVDLGAVHPLPTAVEAADTPKQQQQRTDKSVVGGGGGAGGNMPDLLCELACQTLGCPIASVSVVDERGQLARAATGLGGRPELERELRVFLERVMGDTPAVVLDANVDAQARLAFPPSAPPAIRFFAGSPIYSRAGRKLGHVCVADTAKRDALGSSLAFTMERLASLAVTTMEGGGLHAAGNNQAAADEGHETSAKAQAEACDVELVDVHDLNESAATTAHSSSSNTHKAQNDVADTQERMRRLLLKSYLTQQQLAASSSPKVVRLTPPSF